MRPVKKQGPYEVFSDGVEEPWIVHKNGVPFRQVWTWKEVEAILRDEGPPQHAPRRSSQLAIWRRDPGALKGWRRERTVTPETQADWLATYRRLEPTAEFTVSARSPRAPKHGKLLRGPGSEW